ncbi:ADP-ribose pyrophosphatase YjhB, NUDIX family [Bowdeniella nasicola]|uniref:ADP-ribose pyrophosphatase YjhB, NUDIX family n=1 Tax=Bowdeniella nasicola TaxID=208480 RepID=A0A1H3WU13_9ACTO|nr:MULTISPECIES: CoA pyrophosphatase [Bowdeniella]SDZ90460.1 ADP-ribose pyrophosphatase YjhB, NUDIX family [Bowdeniella nasicola]
MSSTFAWEERLRTHLASVPSAERPLAVTDDGRKLRTAAVLAALSHEEDPVIIMVRRAAALRSHPGQVALPGGSIEAGENAIEAALREAHEEVDLAPERVRVLGHLADHRTGGSDFAVTPVVGTVGEPGELYAKDTGEVASVHQLHISQLADPDHRATATLMHGYKGPAFVVDDLFIWGFTAHLLDGLIEIGGWAQPWDHAKQLDVPMDFFRPEVR